MVLALTVLIWLIVAAVIIGFLLYGFAFVAAILLLIVDRRKYKRIKRGGEE